MLRTSLVLLLASLGALPNGVIAFTCDECQNTVRNVLNEWDVIAPEVISRGPKEVCGLFPTDLVEMRGLIQSSQPLESRCEKIVRYVFAAASAAISGTNATFACSLLGMCKDTTTSGNRALVPLLTAFGTLPDDDVTFSCDDCQKTVRNVLNEWKTIEPELISYVPKEVCGLFPPRLVQLRGLIQPFHPLESGCEKIVRYVFQALSAEISGMDETFACTLLGMCKGPTTSNQTLVV